LQKRKLGRTGLQVSIVGFGGTWISQLSMDEAVKVVHGAIGSFFGGVRKTRNVHVKSPIF
jgi:hypothetical protein